MDICKLTDLLNNEIGRSIGERNKTLSNVGLAHEVLKTFKLYGLWTVETKDNKIMIKKITITEEQYKAAINEIYKKNEYGLNE